MTTDTRLASRKFMIAVFLVVIASIALFTGKLDQSGFITLATLIFTGYCAANVTQKATAKPITGAEG